MARSLSASAIRCMADEPQQFSTLIIDSQRTSHVNRQGLSLLVLRHALVSSPCAVEGARREHRLSPRSPMRVICVLFVYETTLCKTMVLLCISSSAVDDR